MVTIIKDKEPIYETDNYDVVLVGISTHNMFMGNWQGKLINKYPEIEEVVNTTNHGDLRKLGKRITIDNKSPIISLMFICGYPSRKDSFIDYSALENCLKTANVEFKGKKVMTTLLGSTEFDGKGDRDKCIEIINENTKDLDLYVYDFKQIKIREEIIRLNKYFFNYREKFKGDKEALKRLKDLSIEMRKKAYLPTDKYLKTKKNKEEDDILNF